jgi:hypothetical protein
MTVFGRLHHRSRKHMCPRVLTFNPGTGPARYWTDVQPNTRPTKRLENQGPIEVSTNQEDDKAKLRSTVA